MIAAGFAGLPTVECQLISCHPSPATHLPVTPHCAHGCSRSRCRRRFSSLAGLDVVCFSNGRDYVKGWRHAVRQAEAGRVVMVVDSTALLNRRHLGDSDDAWRFPYPGALVPMQFPISTPLPPPLVPSMSSARVLPMFRRGCGCSRVPVVN